jgi:beta-lactam-binding protein with PASTA domain
MRVQVAGRGKVVRQSLLPGTKVKTGETIELTMSIP